MATKDLIVVGGPSGAGKTTFADEYVARHGVDYIGADAIAAELSPQNPARARSAADLDAVSATLGTYISRWQIIGC